MAKHSKAAKTARAVANTPTPAQPWYGRDWILGLLLVMAVFLTFEQVRTGGFIWDDDDHITANPTVIGPLGFKEIWTTSAGDISPLTRSTFWLEHKLWGLNPLPYHLVTVLLQALCALLLWQILRRLRVPGAWLGAAIWTLHPVQVESIAWITETKNTESGLFFLLSVIFFVEELKRGDAPEQTRGEPETGLGWRYGLTLLFAALAMAAKASAVVLPASLCLCAWWVEGRWRWRNLVRMIPVAIMSILCSDYVIWTQGRREGLSHDHPLVGTLMERVIGAADAVWFYVGKLIWPRPLMAMYPVWKIDTSQWYSYLPLLILLMLLALLWPRRRALLPSLLPSGPSSLLPSGTRPYFFVLVWFVTALFPALGLVDSYTYRYSGGYSPVYLHFQYLASMAPLALAGAGITRLADFAIPNKTWLRVLPAGALLLVLAVVSWNRVWVFQTNLTLWSDAAAGNPDCWSCHYNVGTELEQKGQADEAIAEFQKALSINPGFARAQNNLGIALDHKGREDEAIGHFQKAVATDPDDVDANYNLGSALLRKGQADEAIVRFRKILQINPRHVDAHVYLGAALDLKGQASDAIEQYQVALSIDTNDALAHHNLGLDLSQNGRGDEGLSHFQRAVELDPDYLQGHDDLGVALAQRGMFSQAIAEFQTALRLNPEDRSAREYLVRAQAAEAQGTARAGRGSR